MMNTYYMHNWEGGFPWFPFGLGLVGFGFVAVLALAVLALKGYALWHAVKRDEKAWFVALLILNTMGILELIYLYFVVKKWNKPHHHHEHHNHTEHHHHS